MVIECAREKIVAGERRGDDTDTCEGPPRTQTFSSSSSLQRGEHAQCTHTLEEKCASRRSGEMLSGRSRREHSRTTRNVATNQRPIHEQRGERARQINRVGRRRRRTQSQDCGDNRLLESVHSSRRTPGQSALVFCCASHRSQQSGVEFSRGKTDRQSAGRPVFEQMAYFFCSLSLMSSCCSADAVYSSRSSSADMFAFVV